MLIRNKTGSLIALTIIVLCAVFVLHAQKKESPAQNEPTLSDQQQFKEYSKQFPIVEFAAPQPANLEERARRDVVSKKYDDATMPISEYSNRIANFVHWANGLTALPVERSQLVVIGEVLDAKAYLSSDKTGVYSEFNIRVDEVFKDESNLKLTVGDSLIADRLGGRVKYPSGHITLSYISDQGMPIVGQRYVLFLSREGQQTNFDILTGYQLNGDHIALLNTPTTHPIVQYKGADKETFLNELRAALKNSSQDGTAR